MSLKNIRLAIIILTVLLIVINSDKISGHSPVFPETNSDPATAFLIAEPEKSWAIYTSLDQPERGDYYKFEMTTGQRIKISLLTAENPSVSGFLPSFALLVPGLDRRTELPAYVNVPAGYGELLMSGQDPGKASYEPFSPGWFYKVADLDISAPQNGIYYIVVYGIDGKTGNYGLPVGYLESFTVTEWFLVPYNLQKTYVWEGQNSLVTYGPVILALLLGSVLLYRRYKQNMPPDSVSKWLVSIAGFAFLGTAIGTTYQMCLAIQVTGLNSAAFITLLFVVIGIILSLFCFLYGLRRKPILNLNRRISLLVIGITALAGWSGFYIGPICVFLAAIMPSSGSRKH